MRRGAAAGGRTRDQADPRHDAARGDHLACAAQRDRADGRVRGAAAAGRSDRRYGARRAGRLQRGLSRAVREERAHGRDDEAPAPSISPTAAASLLALAPSPERAWMLLPSSLSADVEIDRRPPAARLAAATAAAAESAAEPTSRAAAWAASSLSRCRRRTASLRR